jgi:hypothetical protein
VQIQTPILDLDYFRTAFARFQLPNLRSDSLIRISSVSNYTEVYNIIKKLQHDIYSDIMYPNDKRPKENNGYNTEYKGW